MHLLVYQYSIFTKFGIVVTHLEFPIYWSFTKLYFVLNHMEIRMYIYIYICVHLKNVKVMCVWVGGGGGRGVCIYLYLCTFCYYVHHSFVFSYIVVSSVSSPHPHISQHVSWAGFHSIHLSLISRDRSYFIFKMCHFDKPMAVAFALTCLPSTIKGNAILFTSGWYCYNYLLVVFDFDWHLGCVITRCVIPVIPYMICIFVVIVWVWV